MAFRAMCIALLLSTLPIAGCGTVANVVKPGPEGGGKVPFGGVRQDLCYIEKLANGECGFTPCPPSESATKSRVAPMVFYAADLPFSLVGDVVTWPYTATYSCINQPIPTPPVTRALTPVVPQAPAEARPQPAPVETLPQPRKLP